MKSRILGHTDIKTTKNYTKYELSHLEKEMVNWDNVYDLITKNHT